NNQTNFTSGTLVPVNSGATTGGINFGLPGNAGGITGQVTLIDGVTPVPGAQVSARTAAGEQILFASTDANGNYNTQRRLAAGTYLIRVFAAGFPVTYYIGTNSAATATPIGVTANADTTGINVKLSPAKGGISGQVTDAVTSAPLQNAIVQVFDYGSNSFVRSTSTAADGSYTISGLNRLQAYRVVAFLNAGPGTPGFAAVYANNKPSAGTADVITVPAGGITTLDFALASGGSITGRVTDAATSAPVQGAIIDIFDGASTNCPINNFIAGGFKTDAHGNLNTAPV